MTTFYDPNDGPAGALLRLQDIVRFLCESTATTPDGGLTLSCGACDGLGWILRSVENTLEEIERAIPVPPPPAP